MFTLTVSDEPVNGARMFGDHWEESADLAELTDLVKTPTFKVFAGCDGGYKFWQIWRGTELQQSGTIFQE